MRYFLLFFIFQLISFKALCNAYLSGTVPEDIYYQMVAEDCHPIPDFYALKHTQAGGRIGYPYDESDINLGTNAIVVVCKNKKDPKYKVLVREHAGSEQTRKYDCGDPVCPVMQINRYKKYDQCKSEIEIESFPGGVTILQANEDEKFKFSLTDDGGMGVVFTCAKGQWKENLLH